MELTLCLSNKRLSVGGIAKKKVLTHQKAQILFLPSPPPCSRTPAGPPPGGWASSLGAEDSFLGLVYLFCIEGSWLIASLRRGRRRPHSPGILEALKQSLKALVQFHFKPGSRALSQRHRNVLYFPCEVISEQSLRALLQGSKSWASCRLLVQFRDLPRGFVCWPLCAPQESGMGPSLPPMVTAGGDTRALPPLLRWTRPPSAPLPALGGPPGARGFAAAPVRIRELSAARSSRPSSWGCRESLVHVEGLSPLPPSLASGFLEQQGLPESPMTQKQAECSPDKAEGGENKTLLPRVRRRLITEA